MKILHPLSAFLLFLALGGCNIRFVTDGYSFDHRGVIAPRRQEGSIAPAAGLVEVQNRFGRVRVEAAGKDFRWSWELRVWANDQETAEKLRQEVRLEVEEKPDSMRWTVTLPKPPVPELRGVESNLTLRVPESVTVKLENSFGPVEAERIGGGKIRNQHGSIAVKGVEKDLEAETSFAEVRVEEAGGDVVVRNAHGEVELKDVKGKIQAETSFAGLTAENIKGGAVLKNQHGPIKGRGLEGDLQLSTSFAAIDVEAECEEAACSNQHGDVRLRFVDPRLRRLEAETSFAGLEVEIPPECRAELETEVSFGKVKSALESGRGVNKVRLTLKNRHGDIRAGYTSEN